MAETSYLPSGPLIAFGSHANCTLDLCGIERSVLKYRPSLAGNGAIIALFLITMCIHLYQGYRWRAWGFAISLALGCLDEIIGYIGRIMLYYNPFSFKGFIIQIVCITTAPVFICAAIYVTLSRTIIHIDRSLSRFNPKLLYWIFIPGDLVSLALQASGGAISSDSGGKNQKGVNISLAGLALQVFTLLVFLGLAADFLIRLVKSPAYHKITTNFKLFITFLALSIVLILVRCVYRIDELSDGYSGELIHNEPLFMVLEGAMIVTAVFCLNIGHPGYGLQMKPEFFTPSDEEVVKHN